MEASLQTPRRLDGDKAQRIVTAMRTSVGRRGAAGSTFDVVARDAGVSRGLLHYYFGSKERLLVEVVRRDCDARVAAVEERLEAAASVEEIVDTLAASLEAYVEDEPGAQAVLYELLSASRRSEEIRAELAELYRRWREHLAEVLARKESARRGGAERPPRPWPRSSSPSATAWASSSSPIPPGTARAALEPVAGPPADARRHRLTTPV